MNLLKPDTLAVLLCRAFLTRTSTLLDTFLFDTTALRVMIALPFDFLISMRVVPLSATAKEYFSLPESYARYNESGHASHAHLISTYSPSDTDFLSVMSMSLSFIRISYSLVAEDFSSFLNSDIIRINPNIAARNEKMFFLSIRFSIFLSASRRAAENLSLNGFLPKICIS